MVFDADQLLPPSIVSENNAGPRYAKTCAYAPGLECDDGDTSLSQTRYAFEELVGSAVTHSLSLSTVVEVSSRTTTGVFQVLPPSVDLLTCTELVPPNAGPSALNASAAWYTVLPSEEKATDGSLARSRLPPSQIVYLAWELDSAQVAPPSFDTTATLPLSPPSFQRSCWKAATRCAEFEGSAAT